MNLLSRTKLTLVKAATGAGTTPLNSTAVDMAGYDGVVFITCIQTTNANNYVNAAQGAHANGDDAADLAGTGILSTANSGIIALDIYKPADRYVRLEIALGTSSAVGEIWALQYEGRVMPPTNTGAEVHVTPAEGTL